MLIVLIRHTYNERETRGSLAIDGVPYCQTIEPPRGYASGPVTCNPFIPQWANRGGVTPHQRAILVMVAAQLRGPVTSHQSPVTSNPPKYGVPKELCSNGESGDLEDFNKGRAFSPRPKESNAKGCIPMGWYRVEITYSAKFKRPMPILRMVPGFEGIRIHAGLKVENTQGCICVGERWKENQLTKWLTEAQERREEIYICVTDKDHVDSELPNRSDPYKNCIGY